MHNFSNNPNQAHPTTKTCKDCKRTMSADRFATCNGQNDGCENFCRECRRYKDLKLRRGVTKGCVEQYLKIVGDKCVCCEAMLSLGRYVGNKFESDLRVDHDHESGEIRGIVCNDCNTAAIPKVERGQKLANPQKQKLVEEYLKNPPFRKVSGVARFAPRKYA